MTAFFDCHRGTLDGVYEAVRQCGFRTPFSEVPGSKVYGEGAKPAGSASLTDTTFVAARFRRAMWHRHIKEERP